jgi:copper chaperone CopZ
VNSFVGTFERFGVLFVRYLFREGRTIMGTTIIILVLAAIVVMAILSIRKRIKYGSSCCGTHDATPAKIRVADTNKAHYPYTYTLTIDGMHCSNCVRHVENALNCHEGLWATVDLEKNITLVRAKTPQERKHLSEIIADEGYTLIDFSHN